MTAEMWNSINKLDLWIERNGWAGYDPYDIKELPAIIKIAKLGNRNIFFTLVREFVFELFYSFPMTSRKILGIKKKINSKAMGLLAKAYLNLYRISKKEDYINKSRECLNWLELNYSEGYAGKCWGYPFHWQAKEFIPRGTPSGVVTAVVGDAFWWFFKLTNEQKYLRLCEGICKFFVSDLNVDIIRDDRICFSYTPKTQDHVHNANLFVAEFLVRVGAELHNQQYIDYGLRAVNYSLSHQNADGSFCYYGPPDEIRKWIDNYHTGFVLRSLYSIYLLTKSNDLLDKIGKCFGHYVDNFFVEKTIPMHQPGRLYPIDIHSCAEAILCLSELSLDFPKGLEIAKNCAHWTIKRLQNGEGFFFHSKRKSRFVKLVFTAKIPYMRWGQAWMLLGLSSFLNSINNEKFETDFN